MKTDIVFTEYEDLFEKFAILTIDGGMPDLEALAYLKPKTTKQLGIRLEVFIAMGQDNESWRKQWH